MKSIWLPAGLLLLTANALIVARLLDGGVALARLRPEIHYLVSLRLEADLHGQPAEIGSFLPVGDESQTLTSEHIESEHFAFSFTRDAENRHAVWTTEGVEGHESIVYEAVVDIRHTRYGIGEDVRRPSRLPAAVTPYLAPSEKIQSDHAEIVERARELLDGIDADRIGERIRRLYDFVHLQIEGSDYENSLDALTTLRWGEAFCGGKSRLLAALLRADGVPARMVGGLILHAGSKRVTHVWVEAWVNGVWVPLDPLNDYYAERPGHYLVLYRGDQVLFSRTSNINFRYLFDIRPLRAAPNEQLRTGADLLDAYSIWDSFRLAGISLNLLRVILLLPIGVLVVIVFRSVIGFTTFGTFHPALLAVAFRESGLLWGAALYILILGGGLVARSLFDRVRLLHTPRLAMGLLLVVGIMLAVTYASVRLGANEPAHISMFPIAILAITIESSFTKWTELGARRATMIFVQTLVVIAIIYVVLDQLWLQTLVFTFPEILLMVGAAYLGLGRYLGLRVLEYSRFRWLLVADS